MSIPKTVLTIPEMDYKATSWVYSLVCRSLVTGLYVTQLHHA